jgi:hypothetical protein
MMTNCSGLPYDTVVWQIFINVLKETASVPIVEE